MKRMLMHICRLALSGLGLALAVGSCGKVAQPELVLDSNTNWLMRCSADQQCSGSLRCYCGICTKPCGQDTECGLLSGAQCEESGEILCGGQASAGGLCVLACTQSSDCGTGFDCAANQCVPAKPCEAQMAPSDWDGLYQTLNFDLATADRGDAAFYRYIALTGPDGRDPSCSRALDIQRQALAKLLNSLSMDASMSVPLPVDVERQLYRIDLRDFAWDIPVQFGGTTFPDAWEALITSSPYAVPFVGDDADDATDDTQTAIPLVLADTFIAAATQPEFYYATLQVPERLDDFLLNELQIDPTEAPSLQAGFTDGPEFLARQMQIETRAGWVWQVSEFGRAPGTLFSNPLAAPLGEQELIYTLPNGLQAYAFMSADGRRQDSWSATADPSERDGVARVPRANLRRHPWKPSLRDELGDYVSANPSQYDPTTLSLLLQRFRGSEALRLSLQRDYEGFTQRSLNLIDVDPDTQEPIMQSVTEFDRSVTLDIAAAELRLASTELRDNLDLLDPELAPLDGGAVERSVFTEHYQNSLCVLSVVLENQPDPTLCP